MGDIKSAGEFKGNKTEELRQVLRDSLNNKQGKQVIQLNGKSSILFANLTALTLASCGGGGGGGSSTPAPPTPTSSFSITNQSFDFTEDTASSFNITATGETSDSFSITVDAIPSGGTLTLASGTILAVGTSLTLADLDGITFTPNENVNSEADTIGNLVLSIVDNTISSSATISLIVAAVNDAPLANNMSYSSLSRNDNVSFDLDVSDPIAAPPSDTEVYSPVPEGDEVTPSPTQPQQSTQPQTSFFRGDSSLSGLSGLFRPRPAKPLPGDNTIQMDSIQMNQEQGNSNYTPTPGP